MSPRKIRKGAKAEGSDEKLVELESIKQLSTPGEGHRTLRTRRQTKLKNYNDSDADISLQFNESKQPVKRTRAKKVVSEDVNALANTTGLSNRKRYKKDMNATVLEDSVMSDHSQVQDILSTTKSNTTRGRRRGGRKQLDVNKNTDDNEENENNENIADKNIKNVIISDNDGVSSEESEVATVSKKNKKASANTSSVRFIQLRNRNVDSPNPLVTPESSPIIINLTPHRTTKTPRKSPINIGSPKTHTQTPQRVSKTPRKLPVEADTSVLSEQSSDNETSLEKDESPNSSMRKKKSPKNSPSSITRKSPRSSQLRSPRVVSTKARKSPVKSPSPKAKSPSKKSPMTLELNELDKFPKLVLRRISIPEIQVPLEKANDNFSEPKRASPDEGIKKQNKLCAPKNPLMPLLSVEKTNLDIVSSTPREKARQSLNFSSGLSPPIKKSPLKVESFYGTSPRISSTRIQHENSKIQDITSPLISDDESFDISGVQPVTQDKSVLVVDAEITDDETSNKDDTYELPEPNTSGLKKQNSNDTYELDEPKTPLLKKKKKLMDAKLISIDSKEEEEEGDVEIAHKRVCRVRFASPPMNSPVAKDKPSMRSSRSATPGNKAKRPKFITKKSPTKTSRTSLIDKRDSPERRIPRKRSSSVSSNELKPVESKKRSLSSVDVNRKSISKTLQDSVNRLSKPRSSIHIDKKPDIKPMSAKKIPNFAEIHQKRFAQMESLVDAKKRVEERHQVLMNNVSKNHSKIEIESDKTKSEITKKSAPHPKDIANGVYNRYGFKVRKEEATKILNKQAPTKNIEVTRTQKRMALKGVRSNRRFEVLMQMRNIKH